MKVNKSFTIELELVELLQKEDNASCLVEDLIHNHFHETEDFKKMRINAKIKLLKEQKIQLDKDMTALSYEVMEYKKIKPEVKEEDITEPESAQEKRHREEKVERRAIISGKNSQYLEDKKDGKIKPMLKEQEDEAQ